MCGAVWLVVAAWFRIVVVTVSLLVWEVVASAVLGCVSGLGDAVWG